MALGETVIFFFLFCVFEKFYNKQQGGGSPRWCAICSFLGVTLVPASSVHIAHRVGPVMQQHAAPVRDVGLSPGGIS